MPDSRGDVPSDDVAIVPGWADRDERRRLVAGYQHLVAATAARLVAHDPIGIGSGDNTDEYRAEAGALVLHRDRVGSVEDLVGIVHQVFVEWFDTDLAGPIERYVPIAADLWTLWANDDPSARTARTPDRPTWADLVETMRREAARLPSAG